MYFVCLEFMGIIFYACVVFYLKIILFIDTCIFEALRSIEFSIQSASERTRLINASTIAFNYTMYTHTHSLFFALKWFRMGNNMRIVGTSSFGVEQFSMNYFEWVNEWNRRSGNDLNILSVIKFCFSIIENIPTIKRQPSQNFAILLILMSYDWI